MNFIKSELWIHEQHHATLALYSRQHLAYLWHLVAMPRAAYAGFIHLKVCVRDFKCHHSGIQTVLLFGSMGFKDE